MLFSPRLDASIACLMMVGLDAPPPDDDAVPPPSAPAIKIYHSTPGRPAFELDITPPDARHRPSGMTLTAVIGGDASFDAMGVGDDGFRESAPLRYAIC